MGVRTKESGMGMDALAASNEGLGGGCVEIINKKGGKEK